MRKDAFEWESQNGEHRRQEGINVEPIRNWALLISLCVLNAMNPYFLTTFVLIVEVTKGKRSSRWRKRNKLTKKVLGEA
jgi:hypothetical protein